MYWTRTPIFSFIWSKKVRKDPLLSCLDQKWTSQWIVDVFPAIHTYQASISWFLGFTMDWYNQRKCKKLIWSLSWVFWQSREMKSQGCLQLFFKSIFTENHSTYFYNLAQYIYGRLGSDLYRGGRRVTNVNLFNQSRIYMLYCDMRQQVKSRLNQIQSPSMLLLSNLHLPTYLMFWMQAVTILPISIALSVSI